MADVPQSLRAIQDTLNFVLIEVGKTFQKTKRDGKAAPLGNIKAQISIPILTDRFHSALDDIEEEILRAKAILLRDFEKLQAKKAAAIKPKPKPVLKVQLPSEIPLQEIPSVPISFTDFGVNASQPQVGGDVESGTTLDRLQKSIGNVQKIVTLPNTIGNEVQATKGVGDPSRQEPLPKHQILPNESLFESPAEATDQAGKPSADESKKLGLNPKDEISKDTAEDTELSKPTAEAPTTNTHANSMDIDSLFDGNMSNSDSDNADFAEIDFTAGGDFTFPSTSPSTTAPPANTDLDALMPGLESFAAVNQSDDFSMVDFSTNTNAGNGTTNTDAAMDSMFDFAESNNAGSGGHGGNSSNNDMGIPTESNFDDLLDGMDFGDADEGIGGGDMLHGEFDAAFFGLT